MQHFLYSLNLLLSWENPLSCFSTLVSYIAIIGQGEVLMDGLKPGLLIKKLNSSICIILAGSF